MHISDSTAKKLLVLLGTVKQSLYSFVEIQQMIHELSCPPAQPAGAEEHKPESKEVTG